VGFFYELPEVVARAVLAKGYDTTPNDPRLNVWMNQFEWRITASPMIYQMYTWAHYPVGRYPNVEQFMDSFLIDPRAYAQAARDWLDSDPCTWPEEVQAQVVAFEREFTGQLSATVASVSSPDYARESQWDLLIQMARQEYYEDSEAYLNRFRCTGAGGRAVFRTPAAPTPSPVPTPVPTAAATPAPEVLTAPREPGLAREILVGYLADKLQEEASSATVQDVANRLAYLTDSAPLVLSMYIAEGYRFAVEDEPVFYSAFLVHPGCVVSHPGLSEDQTTAFAEEFSRRWPDVDSNTAVGLAEVEQLTDEQKQEFCKQFNDWIETKTPTQTAIDLSGLVSEAA